MTLKKWLDRARFISVGLTLAGTAPFESSPAWADCNDPVVNEVAIAVEGYINEAMAEIDAGDCSKVPELWDRFDRGMAALHEAATQAGCTKAGDMRGKVQAFVDRACKQSNTKGTAPLKESAASQPVPPSDGPSPTSTSAHAFEDFRQLNRDEVMTVQSWLYDEMGYVDQGPPNGVMDDATRVAIAKAQKGAGFEITGVLTADQFDRITETMKDWKSQGRMWAALSVDMSGNDGAYNIVSKYELGSKAYRDAEQQCNANPKGNGQCTTGVTYGWPGKHAWVAGMQCSWKEQGYAFVSFGGSKQDAYDRIAKQIADEGIDIGACKRIASIKSDGTK